MKAYVDGSGKGDYCYFIEDTGEVKLEHAKGDITGNYGEYMAVFMLLLDHRDEDLDIYSDSQLVVNQLNHEWNIRSKPLRTLALAIWKLCENRKITFHWIPRSQNKAGKILG